MTAGNGFQSSIVNHQFILSLHDVFRFDSARCQLV